MTSPSLESLDAAFFQERSESEFLLHIGAPEPVSLCLEEVRPLGHRRAEAIRDPFALVFRGPAGLRLEQGIYRLEEAGSASLKIFLVQVADKPDGSLFEAIFT